MAAMTSMMDNAAANDADDADDVNDPEWTMGDIFDGDNEGDNGDNGDDGNVALDGIAGYDGYDGYGGYDGYDGYAGVDVFHDAPDFCDVSKHPLSGKEIALVSVIHRIFGPGGIRAPIIVAVNYLKTVQRLVAIIEYFNATNGWRGIGRQIRVMSYTGAMTPRNRQQTIDALNGGQLDVMIMTKTGSEGLNLQAAAVLVRYYGFLWNPARDCQIAGRIIRIGSKFKRVFIIRIISPFTCDEHVHRIVAEKAVEAQSFLAQRVDDDTVYGGSSAFAKTSSILEQVRQLVERIPEFQEKRAITCNINI